MKAQDFNLADQNGKMHQLSEFKGKWLVLYFYPKDFTSGCTKQACTYRDFIAEIRAQGAEVVGVSRDSVESHRQFAQKHQLNFNILSDEKGETIKKYGVFAGMGPVGLAKRTTFLIDPDGEIKKVYENVDPTKDATNILKDLTEINSGNL